MRGLQQEFEAKLKENVHLQIDTYEVYEPVPSGIVEEITTYVGSLSSEHMKFILAHLPTSGTIYQPHGTVVDLPHPYLLDKSYSWQLFNPTVMARLIEYTKEQATSSNYLDDNFLSTALVKTESEAVIAKFMSIIKGAVSNSANQKWAMMLTQRLEKDFLCGKAYQLVDLSVPFKQVASCAPYKTAFTSETAQKAVAAVQRVIDHCNAELQPFGSCLTRATTLALHTLMVQLLISSDYALYSAKLSSIISEFEGNTLNFKSYFLAVTAQETDVDLCSVQFIVDQFQKSVTQEYRAVSQQIFKDKLELFEERYTRDTLQQAIEDVIMTASSEEQVKYVKNPSSVITELFNQKWKAHMKTIRSAIEGVHQQVTESVKSLADWVACIVAAVKKCCLPEYFEAPPGTPIHINRFSKRTATAMLMKALLEGSRLEENVRVGGVSLKLLMQPEPKGTVPTATINFKSLMHLLSNLFSSDKAICNLQGFASSLEAALRGIPKLSCTDAHLDPNNQLALAANRSIGCTEKCPCCFRCCDVVHWTFDTVKVGTAENRHKCTRGHQYRGMAGFSVKGTTYASLRICDDVQDTDMIEVRGRLITWKEFQQRHSSWDFSNSAESCEQMTNKRASMLDLWTKIGPVICAEYPFFD